MDDATGSDIERRWSTLAAALADGRRDDATRMEFWCLLEERLRAMVLQGPANDLASSRVRPRFSGILRDPHAAEDFLSDLLVDLVRRFEEGFFHREEFRGLDAGEGLGLIASVGFVRKRAISHLRRGAASGVVGLPRDAGGGRSLDAGENGGLGASLVAGEPASIEQEDRAELAVVTGAMDGKAVLVLDLSEVGAGAVVATAGLELRPVLDPEGETHAQVREASDRSLRDGVGPDGVADAHARSRVELQEEIGRAVEEINDHPGMEVATIERWERRIMQARARLLIQPLDGRTLADLCGLPSTNAGEQRVSNYRKALHRLLPAMAGLVKADEDA
ncbi:MAG: hypothetical protein GY895_06345 [Phycisphaera sp.]|nr:hypothetical protein [Phycisphaera sp.]